jgi:hypothetical protein
MSLIARKCGPFLERPSGKMGKIYRTGVGEGLTLAGGEPAA